MAHFFTKLLTNLALEIKKLILHREKLRKQTYQKNKAHQMGIIIPSKWNRLGQPTAFAPSGNVRFGSAYIATTIGRMTMGPSSATRELSKGASFCLLTPEWWWWGAKGELTPHRCYSSFWLVGPIRRREENSIWRRFSKIRILHGRLGFHPSRTMVIGVDRALTCANDRKNGWIRDLSRFSLLEV